MHKLSIYQRHKLNYHLNLYYIHCLSYTLYDLIHYILSLHWVLVCCSLHLCVDTRPAPQGKAGQKC